MVSLLGIPVDPLALLQALSLAGMALLLSTFRGGAEGVGASDFIVPGLIVAYVYARNAKVYDPKLAEAEERERTRRRVADVDLGEVDVVQGVDADRLDGLHNWAVVIIWGTWCGHCKQALPALSRMCSEYSEHAVFLAVSRESAADVRRCLDGYSRDTTITFAVDDGEVSTTLQQLCGNKTVPHVYLLSRVAPKGAPKKKQRRRGAGGDEGDAEEDEGPGNWRVHWHGHPTGLEHAIQEFVVDDEEEEEEDMEEEEEEDVEEEETKEATTRGES